MVRVRSIVILFVILAVSSVGSGASALAQGLPGCYPAFCPPPSKCEQKLRVEPIRRTVQVDVPVPCAPMLCPPPVTCPPVGCMPPMACRPNPCCPPPCPTRPVEVRIDVRVRPEPFGQPQPERKECRDLGPLAPVLCGVARALVAPIRTLEHWFPGPDWYPPRRMWCGPPRHPSAPGPMAQPVSWAPTPRATEHGHAQCPRAAARYCPQTGMPQGPWGEGDPR
jgi:hypothetical protein